MRFDQDRDAIDRALSFSLAPCHASGLFAGDENEDKEFWYRFLLFIPYFGKIEIMKVKHDSSSKLKESKRTKLSRKFCALFLTMVICKLLNLHAHVRDWENKRHSWIKLIKMQKSIDPIGIQSTRERVLLHWDGIIVCLTMNRLKRVC